MDSLLVETAFFEPANILASIAIIISIAALIISIVNNSRNFKHNKKSVEPIFTHLYSRRTSKDENEFYLTLKNVGFGPAKINSFAYIFKNERIHNESYEIVESVSIFQLYRVAFDKELKCETKSHSYNLNNGVIGVNEKIQLFEIYIKRSITSNAILFDKLLLDIAFKIEYETIYSEKRTFYIENVTS